MSDAILKYLKKYCEDETHRLTVPTNSFEQALVIPAYDEDTAFIKTIRIKENPNVLGIIVVNKPDNASIKSTHRTFELLHHLKN